jgi:hypothetical protein
MIYDKLKNIQDVIDNRANLLNTQGLIVVVSQKAIYLDGGRTITEDTGLYIVKNEENQVINSFETTGECLDWYRNHDSSNVWGIGGCNIV